MLSHDQPPADSTVTAVAKSPCDNRFGSEVLSIPMDRMPPRILFPISVKLSFDTVAFCSSSLKNRSTVPKSKATPSASVSPVIAETNGPMIGMFLVKSVIEPVMNSDLKYSMILTSMSTNDCGLMMPVSATLIFSIKLCNVGSGIRPDMALIRLLNAASTVAPSLSHRSSSQVNSGTRIFAPGPVGAGFGVMLANSRHSQPSQVKIGCSTDSTASPNRSHAHLRNVKSGWSSASAIAFPVVGGASPCARP